MMKNLYKKQARRFLSKDKSDSAHAKLLVYVERWKSGDGKTHVWLHKSFEIHGGLSDEPVYLGEKEIDILEGMFFEYREAIVEAKVVKNAAENN